MNPKHILAGSLLLLLLLVTAAGAQVTRGGTFTVTVIGTSRTAYDIWPKGTGSMSGEAGDQPPIIVAGQVDVVQDPAGGPYTIGNHPISGGGTIRGDVPPDSSITVATAYYAEVTTDASGYGVVLFQTNHNTATGQQFHIVAENPANPGEDVQVVLGGIPGPTGSRDRPGGDGAPLDGIPLSSNLSTGAEAWSGPSPGKGTPWQRDTRSSRPGPRTPGPASGSGLSWTTWEGSGWTGSGATIPASGGG